MYRETALTRVSWEEELFPASLLWNLIWMSLICVLCYELTGPAIAMYRISSTERWNPVTGHPCSQWGYTKILLLSTLQLWPYLWKAEFIIFRKRLMGGKLKPQGESIALQAGPWIVCSPLWTWFYHEALGQRCSLPAGLLSPDLLGKNCCVLPLVVLTLKVPICLLLQWLCCREALLPVNQGS
jgi:hypothetical protein